MAKLSSVNKNNKRMKLAKSFEAKRAALKGVIYDKETTIEDRFNAMLKLAKLPRNSSKVRIRNRCQLTGRPRGYYRKFKLSRIALRDLGSLGLLPGVRKASW
jgi:small subunit ribosomal protein S14